MNGAEQQRIDKWLFCARALKSRSLAAKFVQSGHIRLNRQKIDQPSQIIRPGDVLTIRFERRVVVWQILKVRMRRGPAEEARTLYEDLTQQEEKPAFPDF